jgi:nitrate reductase gamma subunit
VQPPVAAAAWGEAQVFIWKTGTTMEIVMYIGGILGTILIVALIIFLVRRI